MFSTFWKTTLTKWLFSFVLFFIAVRKISEKIKEIYFILWHQRFQPMVLGSFLLALLWSRNIIAERYTAGKLLTFLKPGSRELRICTGRLTCSVSLPSLFCLQDGAAHFQDKSLPLFCCPHVKHLWKYSHRHNQKSSLLISQVFLHPFKINNHTLL